MGKYINKEKLSRYDIITVTDQLDRKSIESTKHYLKSSGVSSKKIMEQNEPEW